MNRCKGFTLLEVLIALFIFTILSIIMMGGLHTVITAQSGAELSADRLRQLQIAILLMSRDIEQAVNRPIIDASGKQIAAFEGSPRGFSFTHMGKASTFAKTMMSSMERTGYSFDSNQLRRTTWPVLDQAPQTQAHSRTLLDDVNGVRFQYLDHTGRFKTDWPIEGDANQPLPLAVSVSLTFSKWGTLSQLYVISTQKNEQTQAQPQPAPPPPPPEPESES